jgi:hypothetical protein
MVRTSLLSWVSKTATPASTLPTVNEISILVMCVGNSFEVERYVATISSLRTRLRKLGLGSDLIGRETRLGKLVRQANPYLKTQIQGLSMKAPLWTLKILFDRAKFIV